MTDHLNQREESRSEGTPEGAPSLALLAPAGHPGAGPQSRPSTELELEVRTVQSEADEASATEPFAEPVGLPRLRPMKKGQRLVKKPADPKLQISPEQRLLILDTWRRSGLPAGDFSTIVGIAKHTLYTWKKRFEQEGPAGLMDRPRGGRRGSKLPELTKRAILMLKEANPDWGCQRISDMLVRGPALPASPTAVVRVLKEAGYELEEVPTRRHPDKVRRFERARPNQLWQTDLFTFLLKLQNRRVYLVAFMDDHSRFLTGFGLHASQSTALELARHGMPKKPFYVTGQVGGKLFSVHAEGERVILKRQGEERQEVELVSPQHETSAEPASQQTLPEPLCPNGSPVTRPSEPPTPSIEDPGSSPLDQILPQLGQAFSSESDRDEEGGPA